VGEERFEYVFGASVDPSTWHDADHEGRQRLLAERFEGIGEGQLAVRHALVEQILADTHPAVWATAQRLAAAGLDTDRALNQLSLVFTQTLTEGLDDRNFDEDSYAARLDRLPLPGPDEIERALLDVAADAVVLPTDRLAAGAAERLGYPPDDPVVGHLVEHVEDDLTDEFGPLAWLPSDRTAHVASLCDGIVLTHTLNEAEHTIGTLVLSFDLAGFGHVDEPHVDGDPLELVSAEPGHLAWMGPDGWLERFEVGTILAVRVDGQGAVTLEPLATEPPADPTVVESLRRAYDDAVDEPQLPVSGQELVLGMLAHDRAAFAQPQASLTTLCAAAGLDKQASAVAHDPSIWGNGRRLSRIHRIVHGADGDDELAETTLAVLDTCDQLRDGEPLDDAAVGRVLDELADLDVLALATDELIDARHNDPSADLLVTGLLAAADRPSRQATARLLAALHAEATGDWAAAEQHLELSVEADDGFVPGTDRLAWYASDRGDAVRASRLWRRCPRSAAIAQDLATLAPFTRATATLGRNDRCWCGSGRKYKQCHLGVPAQAPLADRVGWLCRKAVGYLERIGPEAREAVMDVVYTRIADDDDLEQALDDPLVMDLVLTEGGWFERFLADRGHLLPDDEALLAASWLTVDRSVHEVTAVRPGSGLALRDLRTGDEHDARERTFSRAARPGTLVCARVVPDGETHQLVGAIVPVAPGTEAALLDLLDGGDPHAIAAWVRDLHRAPQLRTREDEPVVECEIVVTADDIPGLVRHLDTAYDVDTPGEWWTEHHDLDDVEAVIRARFHLDGDRLTITTNSDRRADRILDRFPAGVGVTVLADERTPVDAESVARTAHKGLPDLRQLPSPPGAPACGQDAIAEIQAMLEERWCAEPVPALGGATPREAAADPTRREQLERLLASFDAMEAPPGAFTMRTDRLRARLGL
jgi:hypothetical protein